MRVGRFFIKVLEGRFFLISITLLGVLLRVGLIYYTTSHNNPTFQDEDDYQSLGASLSHGGPYSIDGIHLSAFRPPAEAWLIAIIFRVFGPHVVYVKLVEVFLLAIVPFACSVMGRSLGLSVAAANFGAALAGLHPALAYASTTIYPTVLATFSLTMGLLLSVYVLNGKGKGTAAGAGLAFGLAASTTTAFAPLALVAALVMAVKRHYAAAVIVAVLGTAPVLAWMVRNEVEMGVFTAATNDGLNLFLGANDLATPMSGNNVPGKILIRLPQYEEVTLDRMYRAETAAWIRGHRLKWTELVLLRGALTFDSVGNPVTQGLHSGLAAHLIGWTMLPIILLSLVGLCFSYRQPLAWLTMTAVLLIVLSSALTLTKPRFRFPCDPALSVFSIVGIVSLWNRGRSADANPAQIASGGSSQTTYS